MSEGGLPVTHESSHLWPASNYSHDVSKVVSLTDQGQDVPWRFPNGIRLRGELGDVSIGRFLDGGGDGVHCAIHLVPSPIRCDLG